MTWNYKSSAGNAVLSFVTILKRNIVGWCTQWNKDWHGERRIGRIPFISKELIWTKRQKISKSKKIFFVDERRMFVSNFLHNLFEICWRVLETKRNQENSHKTLMLRSGMRNVISKMPRNRISNHSIFFVTCIKYPRSPMFKKFIHENRELKSFTRLSKKTISDQVQLTIQTLFYCFLFDRRSIWWVLSLTVCAEISLLKNLAWDNCLPHSLVGDRRSKNPVFLDLFLFFN